ncbi:hypothetical protein [Marinomonas sp. THO17]|uniref:hypothetical protein n=1 Tax=Marinomonas sp. THO17 TaxID=3149048 RepID=UPI00336BE0EE
MGAKQWCRYALGNRYAENFVLKGPNEKWVYQAESILTEHNQVLEQFGRVALCQKNESIIAEISALISGSSIADLLQASNCFDRKLVAGLSEIK